MTNSRSHFQRGKGVFACCDCGRRTRTVDQGDSECCPSCYELAGFQNMVWDACMEPGDWKEVDRLVEVSVKAGGDRAKLEEAYTDLFEARP